MQKKCNHSYIMENTMRQLFFDMHGRGLKATAAAIVADNVTKTSQALTKAQKRASAYTGGWARTERIWRNHNNDDNHSNNDNDNDM